jgi:hypothetical protein
MYQLRLDLLLLLLLLNRGLPWKLAECWRRAYLQCVGHQKVLVGALPELFSNYRISGGSRPQQQKFGLVNIEAGRGHYAPPDPILHTRSVQT